MQRDWLKDNGPLGQYKIYGMWNQVYMKTNAKNYLVVDKICPSALNISKSMTRKMLIGRESSCQINIHYIKLKILSHPRKTKFTHGYYKWLQL